MYETKTLSLNSREYLGKSLAFLTGLLQNNASISIVSRTLDTVLVLLCNAKNGFLKNVGYTFGYTLVIILLFCEMTGSDDITRHLNLVSLKRTYSSNATAVSRQFYLQPASDQM